MIELDGNFGEGGGQIVRNALALSIITGKSFHVKDIRKGRNQPGLKPQHLTCINALEELSDTKSEGAVIGSEELTFYPGKFKPQNHTINIGTAGSITLLMQSLTLPSLLSKKSFTLTVIGGTDVQWSMPIDYYKEVFANSIKQYGEIKITIKKRGYYPKGGGEIKFAFKPSKEHKKLIINKATKPLSVNGVAHSSRELIDKNVSNRIADAATLVLKSPHLPVNIRSEYPETLSTGAGLTIWANYDEYRIGVDLLGEKNLLSEDLGIKAAKMLKEEMKKEAPVDKHLADNLIPFLGLFGGEIKTTEITEHTRTNIYTTELFIDEKFEIENNIIRLKKQA